MALPPDQPIESRGSAGAKRKIKLSHSEQYRIGQMVVYEGDLKMLELIKRELGVSEAEAVRTAIRTYGALLLAGKRSTG